jgi:ubiquinone/menaquinone biosynthesis C-methylase UbiE
MKAQTATTYVCPYTREPLSLTIENRKSDEVLSGRLKSAGGRSYELREGIAHLIDQAEETFSDAEKREFEFYQSTAEAYDTTMDWVFKSFYEDEDAVRERMLEPLQLAADHKVLETGCGTCRDSERIARLLGPRGALFLQDLSPNMLLIGKQKLDALRAKGGFDCPTEYFVGNAMRLPFPDGYFDSAFHFGGLNLFSDKRQAILEMARVVRQGGRVVVGDEGLAPWLRDTEYGKILTNSSNLYAYNAPLDCVPPGARNPAVRWFLGNAYYLIDFEVGDGTPAVDLDLPINGRRGGTHRTRYYGMLEGVTPETKQLMTKAASQSGLTLHAWLDRAVRERAKLDLESR